MKQINNGAELSNVSRKSFMIGRIEWLKQLPGAIILMVQERIMIIVIIMKTHWKLKTASTKDFLPYGYQSS